VGKPGAGAIQSSAQGVQARDTAEVARLGGLRWDDLKLLLEVAEVKSLRAAARQAGCSVNTIRSRIERLEEIGGATLLHRSRGGISLTDAGVRLVEMAREMRGTVATSGPAASDAVLIQRGELRIGCSEGIGSLWLTPRLLELQAHNPGLTVHLQSDYNYARDRSREVDVGVTFAEPRDLDLVSGKLGYLHVMLFSSEAYLREHGTPATLDEMRFHKFIEQVAPGINSSIRDFFVGQELPAGFIPIRTNSSIAVFWATVNGAGIAALPTYGRAISRKLIPVNLPVQLRFPMWYFFHSSARKSKPVVDAVQWLKAAFDAERYPWFAEEFVHPDDFVLRNGNSKVVSLFASLVDTVDLAGPAQSSGCGA
jgi:molybdate transport repressor ModE-like protein